MAYLTYKSNKGLAQVEGKHLGNNISLFQDVQQQEQLKKEKLFSNIKRILPVDDPDITLTFKKGLKKKMKPAVATR
jgi:hypothetical protein